MKVLKLEENSKNKVIFHKNDKKILSLLCQNVRFPLSKIAKLLSLSRQSVEYRTRVMEKNNLIVGSRTIINIQKLGYSSYHFFLSIRNEQGDKIFIERCIKHPCVNALINYSGKWNYEVSIMARSPSGANAAIFKLCESLGVTELVPVILLETFKSSILPNYLLEPNPQVKNVRNDPSFSRQFEAELKTYTPDETDIRLLYELSENANITLQQIGEIVHLTSDAVSYRIKNLIAARYILEFRPAINYDVLQFSVQALLIHVCGRNDDIDRRFKSMLKEHTSVLWATEVFGSWDYLIYVITQSQEEIHAFIQKLKSSFAEYVNSYEILFAYYEYKYSFMAKAILDDTVKEKIKLAHSKTYQRKRT